jgi:Tfp pilus assembly protein FimT
MRNRTSQSSAFTLLELVLVMGILVIVVAMVAPSLSGFAAGRRTSYAATRITSMAEYARTQAVTEGRTWRMNFDPASRAVWLTVQEGNVFIEPSSNLGDRSQAAEGIQIRTDLTPQHDGTQNGLYVEFHPDGRTDPVHIWISDPQGRTIEVACLSATERFRILRPEEMTQ